MILRLTVLAFALMAAASTGCKEEDEIRRYSVARPVERLTYTLPDDWVKGVPAKTPFPEEAAFQVTDNGLAAKITVTTLAGKAGGLTPNINRWRAQIKLGEVDEAAMKKDLKEIKVSGSKAVFVDLTGPAEEAARREQILGAVVEHGKLTWFFKMRGPVDLVTKQKAAFEKFLESVKINDGNTGASNG